MTSASFDLAPVTYHGGSRQPPHAHDDLQITVVLRGHLEERVGASLERASALSVVVKDPGVIHDDQFGSTGVLTARLSLRATTLADLVEHPARARAWRWTHDPRVAIPLLRLVSRAAQGDRRFAYDDDDVVDLLAAVSARLSVPHPTGVPQWLEAVVQQVRDDWRPGLSVGELARVAGVHPVYLARCVRRWYGIGAAELLRMSRLRDATKAIADGNRRIATIAHASGFADEPHLCREFGKATGMPPARYRRLAQAFAARARARIG